MRPLDLTERFRVGRHRLVALLLCAATVFSLCGCGAAKTALVTVPADAKPVYPSDTDIPAHYFNDVNVQNVGESGLISLIRDPISAALGIVVKNSFADTTKTWTALPAADSEYYTSDEADVFSLEVIHDSSVYHMNSQDNSVAFGFVTWGATSDGFRSVYLVTDNKACVDSVGFDADDDKLKASAKNDILYRITLDYVVEDGCLYAGLSWENLGDKDDILAKVGFLEYFGATSVARKGDFILVPDGCGAVMSVDSDEEIDTVDVSVYGADHGEKASVSGIIPAYGFKDGSDAFAAVIDSGDALAHITANKAPFESNYNRVGPVFTVTPSVTEGGKTIYSDVSYDKELKICFRFLSGANSSYAGLASACREQLIRNFTLSTRTLEPEADLPLIITAIGSSDSTKLGFNKVLTSFDEAEDILTRAKSKGINNVYMRCSGFLSGGTDSKYAAYAGPMAGLGGHSGLRELNDYAVGQNFNVFLDLSVVTGSGSDKYDGKDINGKTARVTVPGAFSGFGYGSESVERVVKSWKGSEDALLGVLERFDGYEAAGFCISDAGEMLFTDYLRGLDRQAVADGVNDAIAPLSVRKLVMVSGGNFYSLKNADVVALLPSTTQKEQTDSYKAVPFVQIVLHGIVDYGSGYLNLGSAPRDDFLRCVEYGALPSFILTDRSYDDSEKYNEKFLADSCMPFMLECYEASGECLADLRGSRITDHSQLAPGVFCTVYETTTKIYVNYSDNDFTVNGITVEGHSWFRAN